MGYRTQSQLPLADDQDFDIDSTLGFAACVNQSQQAAVLQRYKGALRRQANTGAPPPMPGAWSANTDRSHYDRVTQAQAGVCTMFAYASAHILTSQRTDGPPLVEVVAHNNHVFVLVGRDDSHPPVNSGQQLPLPNTWGRDFVIVDGWAGAMGWDVIFRGTRGYPYVPMLYGFRT